MLPQPPPVSVTRARRGPHEVSAAGRQFPVDIARHPRARRYVLRVTPTGRVRLTVPRGASIDGGVKFAERERDWIEREWRRVEAGAADWAAGSFLWYRGDRLALCVESGAAIFGDQRVRLDPDHRVRALVERHLRLIALAELPTRASQLAADRALATVTISVRNQRSRWGSCSPRGTVTLNWRLVQMPMEVADYVILHELAHRRHPNHSRRFWREVEVLCPWWRTAERWLRKHGHELF